MGKIVEAKGTTGIDSNTTKTDPTSELIGLGLYGSESDTRAKVFLPHPATIATSKF